ncbi:MAG: hypothetical protein ACLPJW_20145 [Rhodomicrobium sp.]
MRTFFHFVFAIVTVFGLPRLANEYRSLQLEAKAPPAIVTSPGAATDRIEYRPAVNAGDLPRIATPVEKLAAFQLVPVSLRPAEAPGVRASQAPALPANGKELISAIQKELSRLGYYDGPDSGRWSRAVRLGAREFIRRTGGRHERHPQPSLELLASLQAAHLVELEAKPENSSDPHPIRQAESSPVEAIAATPQPAQSDDYLPPWMTRHASAAKSEANSAADVTPPAGARDITRQVHRKRHRRERGWNAYAYRGWGGGDWGF